MKFRRIETDYVAIVIIAVCLLCIGAFELLSPAKAIQRAINKSIAEYSTRETANSPLLNSDLDSIIKNGNISSDIAVNFTEGSLNGVGAQLVVDRNDNEKIAQSKFNINYNGTAALAVNTYVDNDSAVLSAPVLYDKSFKADMNELTKRIYSIVGVKYDEESTDENIFFNPKTGDVTYQYAFENIKKGLADTQKKAWNSVSKNAEFTSLEKSEVNGLNCKGYEIKLSEEDTEQYLTVFVEELFDNTDFKNGVSAYFENVYNENAMMFQLYYGITSAQDFSNAMLSGYENMFSSMIEQSEIGYATLQLFVNSGRLINAQLGIPVTVENQQIDINADVDFNGKAQPTDNLSASIGMVSQGAQLKVLFNDTNNIDGTKCTTAKTITIDDTMSTQKYSLITSYDTTDSKFTATAAIESDDEEIVKFSADGTVKADNGYINADMSDISFVSENTNIKADGHLYINPLSNEITPIDSTDAVDIFNLEPEDSQEILEQVQSNLQSILSKIEG